MKDSYTWMSSVLGITPDLIEKVEDILSSQSEKKGGVDALYEQFLKKEKEVGKIEKLFTRSGALDVALSSRKKDEKFLFEEILSFMSHPKVWGLSWDAFTSLISFSPPPGTMKALGYDRVEDLIEEESLYDIAAGLRFLEEKEWMHNTFFPLYEKLSFSDFELRPLFFHTLSKKFAPHAQSFIEKKYHNVSHLKELGFVFVIPTEKKFEGQMLRTSLLLFHYLHEVSFYSRLFHHYRNDERFGETFGSLLRGDVVEDKEDISDTSWLIIQRYLSKEGGDDWRLRIPHLNPEALHWHKAEKSFFSYVASCGIENSSIWNHASWMGRSNVSYNIMDISMTLVEQKDPMYTYHRDEALWNEWYGWYRGYEKLEDSIVSRMREGVILM